jgi:hypothetical protein
VTVTQASLDALAAHTRKRGDTVRTRIEKRYVSFASRTPTSPSAACLAAPG